MDMFFEGCDMGIRVMEMCLCKKLLIDGVLLQMVGCPR